jgi:hypothetical protein
MSTEQIVALLVAERDRLNRAIEALGVGVKRRGRPPKSAVADGVPPANAGPKRGRRTFTAKQRADQAKRMKAYWAARKKKEA